MKTVRNFLHVIAGVIVIIFVLMFLKPSLEAFFGEDFSFIDSYGKKIGEALAFLWLVVGVISIYMSRDGTDEDGDGWDLLEVSVGVFQFGHFFVIKKIK